VRGCLSRWFSREKGLCVEGRKVNAGKRLSGLVSAGGGRLRRGFSPEGRCLGARSYLLSCKISVKSDHPRPSYSDLTNYRWPPSAILDVWRQRVWTTPQVEGPHFYQHNKFGEDILICGGVCHRSWIRKTPSSVEFYFRFQFRHVFLWESSCAWPYEILTKWYTDRCPGAVEMGEVQTRKHSKWRHRTSNSESDGTFWIGKPGFLFQFPSNHTSISLSFGDS